MKLTKSKQFNPNYAAKIVEIKQFTPHPNPKCTRLQCCTIDGYTIAVSLDTMPGIYVYFPVECSITSSYLSANNLYRDKVKNKNPEQGGFFEDAGRVKIIRLQGYPSEGFIMPLQSIQTWLVNIGVFAPNVTNLTEVGTEFDSVDDKVLCKKYEPKIRRAPGTPGTGRNRKTTKHIDKVVDNQFRFHYDTILIKKCPSVISPDDIISITAKVHGTSGISGFVLCKPNLTWKDKIKQFFGIQIPNKYDYLYSSRTVIKNKYYNQSVNGGFYGVDVWGYADAAIRPALTAGLTVYYEIIGFLPNGGYIQKGYDYGYTAPSSPSDYVLNKHFGIQVYRVTYTNPDGIVYEFSARQVQQWCKKVGLTPVEEYYYGYAKHLYPKPDDVADEDYGTYFVEQLGKNKIFNMECLSPTCNNKVPHEGVVIKKENFVSEAFKLKCVKFLEGESKQLDSGEADIESES